MPSIESSRPRNSLGNMTKMMNRLGIATARADEKALAAAVIACDRCAAGEVCRDWLTRAAPTLRFAPAFCVNRPRFDRLNAAQTEDAAA